jgi:hypothetical protein
MNRRKFVQLIGMSATAGLAGCSSDSSDNPNSGDSTETTTGTEAQTETETETESPEPAEFEVVEYAIPETAEIGTEVTLEITIRNTGGQTGDFTAPLHARTPDSNWQEGGDWTFTDVAPGESATAEIDEPVIFDYIQRYEFRLGQSPKTAVLQTVSAKVPWGEEYATPGGYRIRADEPTLQDSYEYEDFRGNIKDAEPDNGGQWAFVNVWVKNETGQANYSPLSNEFGLLYGSSQSDGQTYLTDEPINKDESFEGGELQPGVERSGWIAYEIPSEIQMNELTLAWSQDTFEGQIAANWSVF